MLPEELDAIRAKLVEHMKANDFALTKRVRSKGYYDAEADFVLGLTVPRSPRLEFPLLFLDFESTGLSERAKPIQVAGVVVGRDLTKLDVVPSRQPAYIDCLDDRDAMSPEYWLAQNVHGKTLRQVVKEGRPPADIVEEFDGVRERYPGILLAGQNVGFDQRMLNKLYEMAGKKNPFNYHAVDLAGLAAVHLGVVSLAEIGKVLGLDASQYSHHDALGDVNFTADCFVALLHRL